MLHWNPCSTFQFLAWVCHLKFSNTVLRILSLRTVKTLCRFPCGRWLAKSNDDGSTERLLVAELQEKQTNNNEGLRIIFLKRWQRLCCISSLWAPKELILIFFKSLEIRRHLRLKDDLLSCLGKLQKVRLNAINLFVRLGARTPPSCVQQPSREAQHHPKKSAWP
jgi:hypothetical protein